MKLLYDLNLKIPVLPFSHVVIPFQTQNLSSGAGPPKFDEMEPPSYDVAIKLPTYEEAQQEKMAEQQHYFNALDGRIPPSDPRNFNILASFAPVGDSQFDPNTAELALGTDFYFFASFLSKTTAIFMSRFRQSNSCFEC